jgi:hypothetical protein
MRKPSFALLPVRRRGGTIEEILVLGSTENSYPLDRAQWMAGSDYRHQEVPPIMMDCKKTLNLYIYSMFSTVCKMTLILFLSKFDLFLYL